MRKLITLLTILIMFFFPAFKVVTEANTAVVKQVGSSSDSVTLSCNIKSNIYQHCSLFVYSDESRSSLVTVDTFQLQPFAETRVIDELEPAKTYYVSVLLGKDSNMLDHVVIKKLQVVTAVGDYTSKFWQSSAGVEKAVVKVKPIPGADAYKFNLLNSDNKVLAKLVTSKSTITFKGLSPTEKYRCSVYPVTKCKNYTAVSDSYMIISITCKPVAPKGVVCNSINSSTYVSRFTVKGSEADLYFIDIYTASGSKVATVKSRDKNITIKDSKLLTNRFFKARAYNGVVLDNKIIYSSKTKFFYFTSVPAASAKRLDSSKVRITWNSVKSAKYYDIYFYASDGKRIKVASKVKKESFTVHTSTAEGKMYIAEVLPFTRVKGKTYSCVSDPSANYSIRIRF